jgi:hypothetical protein
MPPGSTVIVDSRSLKGYRREEWHQKKHKGAAAEHHQLVACAWSTTEVVDPSAGLDLLAQVSGEFDA